MTDRVENDRSAHRRQPARDAMDPHDAQPPATAPAIPAAPARQSAPPGWAGIGWRIFLSIFKHRLLTTSGGVAFFSMLALFPALATIVSLYSLFADPHAIPQRVGLLAGVVPTSVIDLMKDETQSLAARHSISTVSTAFLIGLLVSIWNANAGVSALFDALNVVHGETEQRSLLRFYATTFAMTLGAVVYMFIAVIGIMPTTFKFFGLGEKVEDFEALIRWPATLLLSMVWLSAVYRFGPSRSEAKWRWVTWGSGIAAVLLVAASIALTWYIAEFNSYDRMYGSLGAVIAFMTWLWISVVLVLLGAEVDAAMARGSDPENGRV